MTDTKLSLKHIAFVFILWLGVSGLFFAWDIFSKQSDSSSLLNSFTGMAVSGFSEITEQSSGVNPYEASINPRNAKIILDTLDKDANGNVKTYPFTVDVYAYPYIPNSGTKVVFNNYQITLRVAQNQLGVLSVKNNVPGNWKTTSYGSNPVPGYFDYTFTATSTDSSFLMTSTNLAEFTLKPKSPGLKSPATILITSIKITHPLIGSQVPLFNKYTKGIVNVTNKYYADEDCDGFGNANKPFFYNVGDILPAGTCNKNIGGCTTCYQDKVGDCDDDKTDDPDNCPNMPGSCIGFGGGGGVGISTYLIQKTKYCAICKYPGMTYDDPNDDVDNNCDKAEFCTLCGAPAPEPNPTPTETTCTPEICNDNIDNDGDSKIDTKDMDCSYTSCGTPGANTVVVWSYVTELKSETPARIGCCLVNQCANKAGICYNPGQILTEDNMNMICVQHDQTSDWLVCNAQNEGVVAPGMTYQCKSGQWVAYVPSISGGQAFIPVYELTPACGDSTIHPPATTICDAFENCKTCEKDCGACVVGAADADVDGVPDTNELTNAEIEALKYTALKARLLALGKTCAQLADCDGDGITDDKDFCPNTDSSNGQITAKTGFVNAYGCYAADTGTGTIPTTVRPDGCFSSFDTTFYISYYTNILGGGNCINVFGQPTLK
jgi:hypothetical protein